MQAPVVINSLQLLELIVGYLVCGIVAWFGIVLLWKISRDDSLADLLDDPDTGGVGPRKASTSRFQLIIFTFVVALSFFLVVVSNVKLRQNGGVITDLNGLPDVPGGVLALLGISASSYLVSRGISKSANDQGTDGEPIPPNVPPIAPPPSTTTQTTTVVRP